MADKSELVPISIVVSTGRGWPAIEPYLRSYEAAAERAGGEVVIADGSDRPAPPPTALASATRWLVLPRSSVFQLRPAAIEASRGAIVALTEDHCFVAPDWAAAMVAAHADHPEAAIIGGAVDNAARDHVVDWAGYFTVQARSLPPVEPGPRTRLNHANVSYKRTALARLAGYDGLGLLDSMQQAASAGRVRDRVRIDPRPIVLHDQCLGLRGFVAENFHAGRTYGAFVRARGGSRHWLRLMATPAMPGARIVWVAVHGARSRHRAQVRRALPLALVLLFAQAAGQAIGLIAGPGDSPLEVGG